MTDGRLDLDALATLAAEAAVEAGFWYSRDFLSAFIDGDDDRLFPDTDARFIAAFDPATVATLIRLAAASRVSEPTP